MTDICDAAELLEAEERDRGIRAARIALIASPVFDCEDCDKPIPPARKAAMPAARRCAGCQAIVEANAKARAGRPGVLSTTAREFA